MVVHSEYIVQLRNQYGTVLVDLIGQLLGLFVRTDIYLKLNNVKKLLFRKLIVKNGKLRTYFIIYSKIYLKRTVSKY
jgi:hypothetical protein